MLRLLANCVEKSRQLFKFVSMKQIDVHHVDEGPAIIKLLLRFIELLVKLLQALVTKSLADCVYECFKVEREGGPYPFKRLCILHGDEFSSR